MAVDLRGTERFKPPKTRRDFWGMAAAWSAVSAFVMALIGSLRLPMPSVFPESDSRVKLGSPQNFNPGSTTHFPQHQLWLFRNDEGFYAISTICTHLGCITSRSDNGQFLCPCHGSKFDETGLVKSGPAPKGLIWVELGISPEGQLVADKLKEIQTGSVMKV